MRRIQHQTLTMDSFSHSCKIRVHTVLHAPQHHHSIDDDPNQASSGMEGMMILYFMIPYPHLAMEVLCWVISVVKN